MKNKESNTDPLDELLDLSEQLNELDKWIDLQAIQTEKELDKLQELSSNIRKLKRKGLN